MIAPDELERGVSKALDDSNQKHDSVSCPEGVTAQVAESATCTMTVGPVRYSVTVLVRSVEGDQATYDVEVAPQPLS